MMNEIVALFFRDQGYFISFWLKLVTGKVLAHFMSVVSYENLLILTFCAITYLLLKMEFLKKK